MEAVSDAHAPVVYGLNDIILCHTSISHVDGHLGQYRYRDYDAIDLVNNCALEEVWCLLVDGELPSPARRARFADELAELNTVPPALAGLLPAVARLGERPDGIGWLQTSVLLLARSLDWPSVLGLERAALRHQVLRTLVTAPVMLAALHRLRQGLEPVPPDPALGHAANLLYMLTGEAPPRAHARALEQYLMLTAEHGMAASTFAGRVIFSTGADLGSALAGALGAMGGPLHGGAPTLVLDMLDEIGSPEHVEPWLRDRLVKDERIMGFGHRIYRAVDPRVEVLRRLAGDLGGARLDLARQVERQAAALLDEAKPGRTLRANVELYTALVLEAVGLPRSLFSATFALARLAGWSAHLLEQHTGNRLIRPVTAFAGGPTVPVPSPAERGSTNG
ncbi:citrate/2-methylcitrate synthase [Nonomuraea sp. NPDC050783]|uniref:citrate/2-methylcitrate synthase n=1 Tax=Nonomuraea sp. NPDC050783 TaxID=3154634 RepID=UPI0034665175